MQSWPKYDTALRGHVGLPSWQPEQVYLPDEVVVDQRGQVWHCVSAHENKKPGHTPHWAPVEEEIWDADGGLDVFRGLLFALILSVPFWVTLWAVLT